MYSVTPGNVRKVSRVRLTLIFHILAASLFVLASSATTPAWAATCTGLGLDSKTFSEILAQASERVPEIRKARETARAYGATVATYGGVSRELIRKVCAEGHKRGGLKQLRAWLADPETSLPLLDWHRIE